MLKKILENKFIKLYNIVFLIFLSSCTIIRIYLVMISPIMKPDKEGYQATYYSPHSAILHFVFLILILIISNIIFYIADYKLIRVKKHKNVVITAESRLIGNKIMKKTKFNLSKILLFIGIGISFSPIILYCFIHGDYERYIWIIKGPFPFSSFGGGPFQMLMYASLFITGIILIIISLIIKRKY